jgi:putative flippase GtrA
MIVPRVTKFSLVGLLGAALQIVLLWGFLSPLHLPVLLATPLAVELTLLHNFAWHENFTWRNRPFACSRQRISALARFHLSNGCISLFGNTALMYLFVDRFRLPVTLSTVAAIALCGLLNFLFADRWVYKNKAGAT